MTFKTLDEYLRKLNIIAKSEDIAAKSATNLLNREATAHNTEDVRTLVYAYERNRKLI